MADGDIKSIRISVTASTKDAEKKLTALSEALKSISEQANALKTMSTALNEFASAIEHLNNIDLSNFASQIGRISGTMKGLTEKWGDYKVLNAAAKYMNAVSRRENDARKDEKLQLSRQRLLIAQGQLEVAKAKENRLSQAMSGITQRTSVAGEAAGGGTAAADPFANTKTRFSAFTSEMQRSGALIERLFRPITERLGDAFSKLGQKISPITSKIGSTFTTAFQRASSSVTSFATSIRGQLINSLSRASASVGFFLTELGDTIRMSKAATAVSSFADTLGTKLSPVVQTVSDKIRLLLMTVGSIAGTFGKGAMVVGSFSKELGSKLLPILKTALGTVAKFGLAVGSVLATGAKKAVGAVASLAKTIGGMLVPAVRKSTTGLASMLLKISTAPFVHLGKSISSVVSRLHGFFAAVKRIAVYRAIRWALKALTQAFKEGMENLYQYSMLIDGTFAKSMDMLATSALYAKNSLAAMAAPIVNVVAPAVDVLVDRFVDLLNTVNELVASLTGASTWTKALKYPIAYADAADDANGKAKKLRATLLGFDEINRLDDNNKGSRGSAADQLDYSKMFEEQVTTSRFQGIISTLKEAFTSGDFTEIGRAVGEKLKKGLDSIPWKDIQDRVRKNATSVATAINGFISVPGLAESIGRTIGEAFNTVTTKIKTFFGTVEWSKLGEFVGTSINTALNTINFTELGRTIFTVLKSAFNFAKGLLGTIDWNNLGKKIGEFLNGIDFAEVASDLAETFGELIGGAIDACWSLLKTSPVAGTLVIAALGLKVGGLLGASMASGVAGSGLTGKISALIPTAATLAVTAVVGYKIGNKIYDSFSDEFKDELADTMGAIDDFFGDVLGLESEAYQLNKHNWDAAKNLTENYYALAKQGEQQHQWLLKQGYSEETTHRAMQLKASMEQIDKQQELRKTMGWQTNELALQMEKQRMLSKYTDDEIKAWMDLTKETIKINFEATFGSWSDMTKKIKDAFDKAKSTIKGTFSGIGQTLGSWISDALGLNLDMTTTNNGKTIKLSTPTLKKKAVGGDVQTGTVFLAGESGAEIIASSGNHTSVSNRDQIAESVAMGNEEGNELLRELLSVGRSILAKDTTVVTNITTGQITSALNRANVRNGSMTVPVALGG